MLIGHSKPTALDGIAITGTGATIVTSETGLVDGAPGLPTRFTFLTPTSATTDVMGIELDFENSPLNSPRIACLLGVTLPVGTLVRLRGREAGDPDFTTALGGNTATSRVYELPNGSRCIWWITTTGLAFDGYRIEIFNDVFGSPAIDDGSYFDIGEFAVFEVTEVCARAGTVQWSMVNATNDERSLASQAWPDYVEVYRQFSASLSPREDGNTWGVIDVLAYKLAGGPRIAVVPLPYTSGYILDISNSIDTERLHRASIFGIASEVPGQTHITRRVFGGERLTVREIPARRAYVIDDESGS